MRNSGGGMNARAIRPEDPVIIYLVSLLLYAVGGFIIGSAFPDGGDAYVFLAYALPQVCYIAVTFIYMRARKVSFRLLPPAAEIKVSHYVIAVAMGLGLFFFALLPNYGLQLLFELAGKNPTVTVPDLTKPLNIVLAVVIICVLPAVGEELVFRKSFCDGFASYGNAAAIILSGLIFGLSHLSLAQTVHQVFLGCVLSYLYIKTRNVTLTGLIHLLNNVLALFLPGITGAEIWNNITVLGISCAAGAAAFALSVVFLVRRAPRVELKKGERPSYFVIGFMALLAVLWIIAAVVA